MQLIYIDNACMGLRRPFHSAQITGKFALHSETRLKMHNQNEFAQKFGPKKEKKN